MDGVGLYRFGDEKRLYLGEYEMNCKHGFGIFKFGDQVYIGHWKNGKANGLMKVEKSGQNARYSIWENGKHLQWFDDQTVKDIQIGKIDYR